MKKLSLAFAILFTILTLLGIGYVLFSHGKTNAGIAVIPMVFAVAFITIYRNKK